MDGRRQLGEFLQTRRAQLRPEDLGLAVYGDRRRVPGLRREGLALLAGVSASYYARLEQGLSSNASPTLVLGRNSDVLVWNRAGHALFAGHLDPAGPDRPGQRPNMARLVFRDGFIGCAIRW